jgi:hypothetical protein
MSRMILLALALSLCQCAAKEPEPQTTPAAREPLVIRVDAGLGKNGVLAVVSAVSRWAEKTGICFTLRVEDGEGDVSTWADDKIPTIYAAFGGWRLYAMDLLRGEKPWIGVTLLNTGDVFLSDCGWKIRQVAMHEIGHILGLGHSEQRSSTMYAFVHEGPMDILPSDAKAARLKNKSHLCN